MTRAELAAAASKHDGCCKVIKSPGGPQVVGPDIELGYSCEWTYFMSDEADSFPFDEYGITP